MFVFRFLILTLLIPIATCVAQPSDTAFLALAKKKRVALYTESTKDQSRLYNGSDYVIYISIDEEHPYYKLDDWENGSITYWGEQYDSVPLRYDLSKDQIITEHIRGNALNLVQEKVQAFTLFNHTFIRISSDDKHKIQEGYYDVLHDGKVKLYAKHTKLYQEKLETRLIIPRFEENTRYYIMKDGIFYNVKSKSGALKIFADHKQDVKSFIRKNGIYFHEDREKALVRVTEYYNTFKHR